jgi:hypothetical protein
MKPRDEDWWGKAWPILAGITGASILLSAFLELIPKEFSIAVIFPVLFYLFYVASKGGRLGM